MNYVTLLMIIAALSGLISGSVFGRGLAAAVLIGLTLPYWWPR